MREFNIHDSDSLVLADIRELLLVIAVCQVSTVLRTSEARELTKFMDRRMDDVDSD